MKRVKIKGELSSYLRKPPRQEEAGKDSSPALLQREAIFNNSLCVVTLATAVAVALDTTASSTHVNHYGTTSQQDIFSIVAVDEKNKKQDFLFLWGNGLFCAEDDEDFGGILLTIILEPRHKRHAARTVATAMLNIQVKKIMKSILVVLPRKPPCKANFSTRAPRTPSGRGGHESL
jgi:hypothetical protein